ncbi:MAG: acylphosphatase [Verrucomicrobia bacterium]|nr:acylphosphatase [Verrucomicrobiota bacterium]
MGKRARIVVVGDVQGVSYRLYAEFEGQKLGLKGWVQNRPNGSVELCAEGPADAVDAMIAWCRKAPPTARVKAVKVTEEAPTGEFTKFETRR